MEGIRIGGDVVDGVYGTGSPMPRIAGSLFGSCTGGLLGRKQSDFLQKANQLQTNSRQNGTFLYTVYVGCNGIGIVCVNRNLHVNEACKIRPSASSSGLWDAPSYYPPWSDPRAVRFSETLDVFRRAGVHVVLDKDALFGAFRHHGAVEFGVCKVDDIRSHHDTMSSGLNYRNHNIIITPHLSHQPHII